MRKLLPVLFALASVPGSAFAQSYPSDWKSWEQTGDPKDIVPSTGTDDSVAAWLKKKVDVSYGSANDMTINGGKLVDTDISSAISNGSPISSIMGSCPTSTATVYYGAENSAYQMGVLANTASLRATGNVLPYQNVLALLAGVYNMSGSQNAVGGPVGLSAMQTVVANSGTTGIAESWYTAYLTPNVAASEQNFVFKDTAGNVLNDAKIFSDTGFKPAIMMMNAAANSTSTSQITDADLTAFQTALTDVPTTVPSVKYVYPYISEDPGQSYKLATDDYYANTRKMLLAAGGVGLDVPAGLYVLNDESYLQGTIDTIKYANANGLRSIVLLSPFGINEDVPYAGTVIPQWRHDSQFLSHVRKVIAWLKENDALPSAWSVVSYSPLQWYDPTDGSLSSTQDSTHTVQVTANTMGSDTDVADQSVAYVARWVAENAPVSQYVSMPSGILNQSTSAPCATTVLAGNSAMKPSLGADTIGLGSLAYEDSNNAELSFPNLNGAQMKSSFNYITGSTMVFGIGDASKYLSIGWDKTKGALVYSGNNTEFDAPVKISGADFTVSGASNNIIMQSANLLFSTSGSNGIVFQNAAGTANSWIGADGSGGVNMNGTFTVNGSMTVAGSNQNLIMNSTNAIFLGSGNNGVYFRNQEGNVSSSIVGDTFGGMQLGAGAYSRINGTLQIRGYSKTDILALSDPLEGEIVNDNTDNVPVIYENGSWYPLTLGTALSN